MMRRRSAASSADGSSVAQCDIVFLAQENGKALGAVERLLGKAQYDKFDPKGDRTMEDLDFLMEALMAAAELDPKE